MCSKYIPLFATLLAFVIIVNGQRSPYAGSRPTGYKDRLQSTNNLLTTNTNDVVNRLGESGTGTTQRLPYDALGDAFIVNHSNQLPEGNRPFWLLNQAHIEAQRGGPGVNSAGISISPVRPQTAAQATANNANNNGVVTRFAENNVNSNSGALRPSNENVYDHTVISQPPVVYPANLSPEQRRQMQLVVEQQQSEALEQRRRQQLLTQNQQQQQQQRPIQNQQMPLSQSELELLQQLQQRQQLSQNQQNPQPQQQQQQQQQFAPSTQQQQQGGQQQQADQKLLPQRPNEFPIFNPQFPPATRDNEFAIPPNSFHIAPYFLDYDA